MKKTLCYIVTLLLVVCCVLTACNSTKATTATIRWNTESYIYDITLADISDTDNQFFNIYDGYCKDFNVQTNGVLESKLTAKDEIVPESVSGTLDWDITTTSSGNIPYCTFSTKQELHCRYETEMLKQFDCYEQLANYIVKEDEQNGWTELKSFVYKTVNFTALNQQKPLSSHTIIVGYYLGQAHQEVSNYLTYTTYADNKTTTTVAQLTQGNVDTVYKNATALASEITENGGFDANAIDTTNIKSHNTTQSEIEVPNGRNYIDANQMLLYVRSLQKDADNFLDAPSVIVFEPFTGTSYTASFAFNHSAKTLLKVSQPIDTDDGYVKTVLNQVNVSLGGNALLCQLNLPDNEALGDLDKYNGEYKYTTVHFRSGYCSYTMRNQFLTEELVSALQQIAQ